MPGDPAVPQRPKRVDARRNLEALLEAARVVFAVSGVDAPAKEIADLAQVGVGTLYRHFPHRADLVIAVLEREIDACADAATVLAADRQPADALAAWLGRYAEFLATKDGLATALQKGEPAFEGLAQHFWQRFGPALGSLLEAAAANGDIRPGVSPEELLAAIASLCLPVPGTSVDYSRRMVALLIDGLRYGSDRSSKPAEHIDGTGRLARGPGAPHERVTGTAPVPARRGSARRASPTP